MLGTSVALDDRYAVVGAFNRDSYITGINAGSGYAFDLSFLNFAFSSSNFVVSEGVSEASLSIERCGSTGSLCSFGSLYVNIFFYLTLKN